MLLFCEYFKIYPQGDDRVLFPNKPIIALDIDDVCLDFVGSFEKKTGKKRVFTVPLEIYSFLQNYLN